MLEELRRYDNLGTPTYFWEFFEQLRNGDSWTVKEMSEHFFNRIIDDRSIFDGCIPLLQLAKVIDVDKRNVLEITYAYKYIFHSLQLFQQKLLEGFLLALSKDQKFYDIFTSEYCSYDFIYKSINIDFSAFGLKYANIRDLLIDFDFFKPHPDFPNRMLIVNSRWKKFFEINFSSEIKKRKISIDELRKQQEQQQINGELAERFVLQYEQLRLDDKDGIQWIAPYDSGAGYDILSFQEDSSLENDRFIEVKSYTGTNPYFYWTKNEVSVAKRHQNKYCIYLVNRAELDNPSYEPNIIPDPVNNILNNEKWEKEIDKYYITGK